MRIASGHALIVDDEPDVCWALAHVLRETGVVPVTASSAREAQELASERGFRLIFVDAKLRDLDGIELAGRLRATHPGTPIILISGYFYGDDAEVHRAIATGVISGFVSKPFLHDEIRRIARAAVG